MFIPHTRVHPLFTQGRGIMEPAQPWHTLKYHTGDKGAVPCVSTMRRLLASTRGLRCSRPSVGAARLFSSPDQRAAGTDVVECLRGMKGVPWPPGSNTCAVKGR
ncbi:hypothetical protein NDU88_004800 [Pleurodeles waltl]|uniref:Uncharacterized protein n=1 Tax=Pleurodeles waltl TaxID=8319 RepID=A0AAV7SJZ0_PLEWA|nr:hypothetical protein NDU88_004800 [Pleurodeles waltl]